MVLKTGLQIPRFLLSRADVPAVPKEGRNWTHHCDPCREVTLSPALAATTLAHPTT